MPEDTGAMKESTAVVTGSSGATGVQIGVDYWRYVNSGWSHFEGYHFVEESREFVRPDFIKDLRQFVRHLR
jgi:calcineurin-like phosphoesterase